jgi:hypothetical protein
VLGGAALVVLGTIVPFNDGPAVEVTSLIDRNGGWRAVEPIGAVILAAVLVSLTGRLAGATSALIGLGTYLTLLWVARDIGFPAWQPDDVSSVAPGGSSGLPEGSPSSWAACSRGRRRDVEPFRVVGRHRRFGRWRSPRST